MPNPNIETKIILKIEDQVPCVTVEAEKEIDKFRESMYKAGKLSLMNLTWWQRLEQRLRGVTRHAEELHKVRPAGEWTGRAAALARLSGRIMPK